MHLAPDGREGHLYNAEEIYHMLLQRQGNASVQGGKGLNGDCGNESGIGNGKDSGSGSGKNGKDDKAVDKSDFAGIPGREKSGRVGAASRGKSIAGTNMPGNSFDADEPNQQVETSDISSFDRHDLWQGICDKTQLRDDWNGRIRNAIKECGDSIGMPQSILTVVQELTERVGLDWKQLLHDFLQVDQLNLIRSGEQ